MPVILPQTAKLTTEPPEPGIYSGIPAPVYFSWRAVSSSLLKVVHRETLAHARATMRGEREDDTAAKKFGRAVHTYILEPRRFAAESLVVPKMQPNDKGKLTVTARNPAHARYAALLAQVGGDEDRIVFDDELAVMKAMRDRLYEDSHQRRLCEGRGEAEVSIIWDDAETGLRCKCRADKLYRDLEAVAEDGTKRRLNIALDYKTTCSADAQDFLTGCANFGYDMGGAFYTDGIATINSLPTEFYVLAQEKEAPYEPRLVRADDPRCSPTGVECGRIKVRAAMRRLAEALQTDKWPGYPPGVLAMQLPHWAVPVELSAGAGV